MPDHILTEKGVTCTPTYWSERDDWTLAMVAAGLGFAFMPENAASVSWRRGVARHRARVSHKIWSLVNGRTTLLFAGCGRVHAGSHAKKIVWQQSFCRLLGGRKPCKCNEKLGPLAS